MKSGRQAAMTELPSLLLPVGTPEALDAALAAGADEVYFGCKAFNARMRADNFDKAGIADVITKCHFFGVSANITLNTAIYDKEYDEMLSLVEHLYKSDVDSLIVADLGAAHEIKKRFPDLRLHASTQASCHNASGAKILSSLGFSRVVLARECSFGDIVLTKRACPDMEYEIFVHGAHCVCHSGMCSLSACMGGRSGNRGECAQPCRQPDVDGKYRLSLKDMCLASYIPRIIDAGVSSLKIEGRMKSPEYVYTVGKIYRRLLDEQRAAEPEELEALSRIFSRGGFTDGYFTHKIGVGMLGVRSDNDKAVSKDAEATAAFELKNDRCRLPVSMSAELCLGRSSRLQLSCETVNGRACAVVYGAMPEVAKTAPLSSEQAIKNLSKLGATPFSVKHDDISLIMDEGISLSPAQINSLRRTAVEKLVCSINTVKYPQRKSVSYTAEHSGEKRVDRAVSGGMSAHFTHACFIPPRIYLGMFSHVYLPLEEYLKATPETRSIVDGVEFPSVVLEHEFADFEDMAITAQLAGAKHAYINNIGTLNTAIKYGYTVHGGLGLNVFGYHDAELWGQLGCADVTLSSELKAPQISSTARSTEMKTGAAVYGKLPVMTLEKCIIRDIAMEWKAPNIDKCSYCDKTPYTYYTDRLGCKLPIRRTFSHRNVMYNSVPIYMADKSELISSELIGERHFFFTDEEPIKCAEIIDAYRMKRATDGEKKRL